VKQSISVKRFDSSASRKRKIRRPVSKQGSIHITDRLHKDSFQKLKKLQVFERMHKQQELAECTFTPNVAKNVAPRPMRESLLSKPPRSPGRD
jgi:hypothetical protein